MSPSLMQILIVVVLVLIFSEEEEYQILWVIWLRELKVFVRVLEDETNDKEIENNDHDSKD